MPPSDTLIESFKNMAASKKTTTKGRCKINLKSVEIETKLFVDEATDHLKSGIYDKALLLYSKALELSPNDKNALLARSKCHLLLGEPRKALEDAQSALRGRKKNSHSAKALFFKAEALFHLGDFELSLVYYYRGIKIRPEFDQFRLGIQKAKEAIENILGGNSVTMPKRGNPRVENSEVPRVQDKGSRTMGTEGLEVRSLEPRTSSSKHGSISLQRRVNAPGKRTGNLESRLLGQLNIDKRYLQDFVKRSGCYYETHFPQFTEMRKKAIKVLMQENEAKQLMLLIGRESLSEDEKLALDVAHLLTEDFLQQDNYSSYDHFCPFYKTYGMLRNIVSYHELACKAVVKLGQPWDVLRYKFKELQNRLGIMKFLSPIDDGEELIEQELYTLYMDIQRACEEL